MHFLYVGNQSVRIFSFFLSNMIWSGFIRLWIEKTPPTRMDFIEGKNRISAVQRKKVFSP